MAGRIRQDFGKISDVKSDMYIGDSENQSASYRYHNYIVILAVL